MIDDIYTDMPDFTEFGSPVCSQVDPELFFPRDVYDYKGNPLRGTYENAQYAKSLCGSCPYKMACFSYAMQNPELGGIWGGTTDVERINARRRLRRQETYRTKLAQLDVK